MTKKERDKRLRFIGKKLKAIDKDIAGLHNSRRVIDNVLMVYSGKRDQLEESELFYKNMPVTRK